MAALVVVVLVIDDAAGGRERGAQRVALGMIIGRLERGQVEEELASVVEHEGAVEGRLDLCHHLGVPCFESIAAPNHEGHLDLVFEVLGIGLVVAVPSLDVAVVIDLVAVVGEIDDDGVALAVEVEDSLEHGVVVERGVLVVGDVVFLIGREPRLVAVDAVGCEMGERRGVTLARAHVLPHEMKDDEVVAGGRHAPVGDEIGHHLSVVGKVLCDGVGVGQSRNFLVIQEIVDGDGIELMWHEIALHVPKIDVEARAVEHRGKRGTVVPILALDHAVTRASLLENISIFIVSTGKCLS